MGKTPGKPAVNDGIDYAGISFPMPLHDIDKLEVQTKCKFIYSAINPVDKFHKLFS